MPARETAAVLLLLSSLKIGGSEAKTVRLANSLAERGFDVTIAHLDLPCPLGSAVSPQVRVANLQRRGKLSVRALGRLRRTIRDRGIRTIVSVNLYPALYARLAQLAARGPRLRFVAAVNTTEIRTRKLALQMVLYAPVLRSADLVIFGAETQRRLWQQRYGIGARGQLTRVIYNSVDTERFRPPRDALERSGPLSTHRFVLGTVGQLRPEKAHLDLIRATSALRARGLDAGALIVGEGRERARIEAEIDRLDLRSHVVLAGEAHDVRPFLSGLDVFVLCSVEIETFSNAVLEAMASGVPVVSSDVGGMHEALAFGGGLLYPRGDVTQLTRCLERLLEDQALRKRLGAEARHAALDHFAWSRMVQEFAEVLAAPDAGVGTIFAPIPLDSP